LNLIKLIAEENNFKWNLNMVRTMFLEAYELEQDYIKFILPTPLLSYNQTTHMQYVQYLMNLRCIRAGLPVIFPEFDMRTHPVPWAGEMIEVKKEKNFFETRVTEYRSGSSLDFGEHVDWEKKRAELATKDAMYHLGYTRNKKPSQ
jgi:ribonucleoside-diphosphate reductase beta chain